MISRILFIALNDCISVISVSEKGKSASIPFDGEIIFKLKEDFWSNWCAQTAYLAPKNNDDMNATICDFCFILDKDYPFAKDYFLETIKTAEDSIWTVEMIRDVLKTNDIVKQYHEIVIRMPNAVCFSVIGNADAKAKSINTTTNISDEDYKLLLEEKIKKESEIELSDLGDENRIDNHGGQEVKKLKGKKEVKKKIIEEESSIVKYNKKLRADEKANA